MFKNTQNLFPPFQSNKGSVWKGRIAEFLAAAGVTSREPMSMRFETEGLVLAKGLDQTFRRVRLTIRELEGAIEGIRPFIRNGATPGLEQAHTRLNRAVGAARELLPMLPWRG